MAYSLNCAVRDLHTDVRRTVESTIPTKSFIHVLGQPPLDEHLLTAVSRGQKDVSRE